MILIRYLAPAALGSLLVKAAEEQTAIRESCKTSTEGFRDAQRLYSAEGQKEGRPQ
ncbi:hypothetical protein [Sneathiella sp.]|jgi:hypothetical protein|uniref:hypothetical protein n=1 Tax=Sneathiella sp. TaxID=1964365 RepID=UPI0025FC75BF|nr:hypothetical protein [Sneathiella sp.]|tara:strand:+ start:189 stop:356 length:168 start_codon:yes stop_codon:yes gene_type:complete